MNKKIEITDQMVERARNAALGGPQHMSVEWAHRVLDAALNPPSEPEIEVTEEMYSAGMKALTGTTFFNEMIWRNGLRRVYRAMRRLEPEFQNRTEWDRTVWTHHERAGDSIGHLHRRKDDPQ